MFQDIAHAVANTASPTAQHQGSAAWEVYTNGCQKVRKYGSKAEMCAVEGIDGKTVDDAIKHNNGKFGAFTFIKH
jgi:hypothetical protein